MDILDKLKEVCHAFDISGDVVSAIPYGEGHINTTYLVTTSRKRYILQKMNERAFKDIDALMKNIYLVTDYIHNCCGNVETLNIIPTKDGSLYHRANGCWRIYDFIENTVACQTVLDKRIFENAGEAFGEFQKSLHKFDSSLLSVTIPDFHNTPKRFDNFTASLQIDKANRSESCKPETEFILSRRDTLNRIVNGLSDGTIPTRVTHNDTKLNNILFDANSGIARAIIDLDTVMPGSLLYDFGDAIRFGASTAAEDEKDLAKVHFSLELYESYQNSCYNF